MLQKKIDQNNQDDDCKVIILSAYIHSAVHDSVSYF